MKMELSTLRHCVISDEKQRILFATDVLSQPASEVMLKNDKLLHHQCSRALPIATERDIVVLQGTLDEAYHRWLRSFGLSTDNIVEYGEKQASGPLSNVIRNNPGPVLSAVGKDAHTVYLAFYLAKNDIACAKELGVHPFGCDEEITSKYFDKLSFKQECQKLGIPTIEGHHHKIDVTSPLNRDEMAELIHRLLSNYGKVIVRGTDGSAGRSLYTIDQPDVRELYEAIVSNRDKTVLIEPFLNVVSSPNDQWMIGQSGEIRHFGLSAQLFQGLKHAGNFFGQYYSPRVAQYIEETSSKIVQAMAEGGYRGVLGVDYIVCEEGIFPIENNARLNGSSFALELFHIISKQIKDVRCWKFFKAKCDKMSFTEFKEKVGRLLFDGKRVNSVFPFVTGLIPEKGEFIALLLAEDTYHIDYLQDALTYAGIHRA